MVKGRQQGELYSSHEAIGQASVSNAFRFNPRLSKLNHSGDEDTGFKPVLPALFM